MSDLHTDHHEHDYTHAEHVEHRASSASPVQALFAQMSRGLGISLGVAVVIALGITTYGLYRLKWSNPVTDAVVHVLPYPAATVNGKMIRYADYADDLVTVKRFFAKQKEQGQAGEPPSDAELQKGVLDRLIQTEILKQEAAKYAVTVSAADIDAEYAKVAASSNGKAEQQIQDLYGWTPAQFKEKVMLPYLLQSKLADAVSKDDAVSGDAKKKADEALAKVQGGADFGAVAKEYSADPGSAAKGGQLGWFAKGVMVPEFEAAAFALAKGETSGLVKSQFGWHIIRVTGIKKDKAGEVTEVEASHILIAGPKVEDYLKAKFDAAKISRYVQP